MSSVVDEVGRILDSTKKLVDGTAKSIRGLQDGVENHLRSLHQSQQDGQATLQHIREQGEENSAFLAGTTDAQSSFLQECQQLEAIKLSVEQEQQLDISYAPHALTEPNRSTSLPENSFTQDDMDKQQQAWIEQNNKMVELTPQPISTAYTSRWEEVADNVLVFIDEYQKQLFAVETGPESLNPSKSLRTEKVKEKMTDAS